MIKNICLGKAAQTCLFLFFRSFGAFLLFSRFRYVVCGNNTFDFYSLCDEILVFWHFVTSDDGHIVLH